MNNDYSKEEIKTIQHIANSNGLHLHWKDSKNILRNKTYSTNQMTYLTKNTLNYSTKNIFHKQGYNIRYLASNSLNNLFLKIVFEANKFNNSGLYKLSYNDCDKQYTELTGL